MESNPKAQTRNPKEGRSANSEMIHLRPANARVVSRRSAFECQAFIGFRDSALGFHEAGLTLIPASTAMTSAADFAERK